MGSDLQMYEDETNCGGSDPSVTQCLIPMDTLTQGPFNLGFNALVVAQATAINDFGSSTPSILNTDGARIRRVPDKMSTVTIGLI